MQHTLPASPLPHAPRRPSAGFLRGRIDSEPGEVGTPGLPDAVTERAAFEVARQALRACALASTCAAAAAAALKKEAEAKKLERIYRIAKQIEAEAEAEAEDEAEEAGPSGSQ